MENAVLGAIPALLPRGYTTRERVVEGALRRAVEARGGLCLKFSSPGRRGVPDRIVLLPGAPAAFVEVKRPGQRPTALQRYRAEEMRGAGALVHTLDRIEAIPGLLRALEGGEQGREGSRCGRGLP
jgi:hypothetical protein